MQPNELNEYENPHPRESRGSIWMLLLKIVIPMVILATGAAAGLYLKDAEPEARKKKPKAGIPMVEVMTARPETISMDVAAMGIVIPKREVVLKSQVSGVIASVSKAFEPGRVIQRNAVILKIDSRDYAIAVRRKKGDVAAAKAALDLEKGNQDVAEKELEFIRKTAPEAVTDPSLALRRPQLAQAKVKLDLAKADLEQAELNLSRTTVRAPFSGMITERFVNLGSYAGNQTDLVTLVAVDAYWIEAAVPLDRLHQIDLGQEGGVPVRITSTASGGVWEGRTVRLTGTFTDATRMAKLLIAVEDPLKLIADSTGDDIDYPLMLGDYVQVEILGKALEQVISLPRYALRENGTVWIAADGKLSLRSVDIVWKNSEKIFISAGLLPGAQVILSDLGSPVEGMPLRKSVPGGDGDERGTEDGKGSKQTRPGSEKGKRRNLAAVTDQSVLKKEKAETLR